METIGKLRVLYENAVKSSFYHSPFLFRGFVSMTSVQKLSAKVATFAAVLAVTALSSNVAHAASVANGGFEAGLTGWAVVDQPSSSGSWFSTGGGGSPQSGFSIPAPSEGSSYAVTDQFGPGSHVLFQDVLLEAGSKHTLKFNWFAQDTTNSGPIDAGTMTAFGGANQHFRVDLVAATFTDWFGASSSNAGVLANLLAPTAQGSTVSGFNTTTFDLTPWAGSTVRLAFREVDNQGFFQAGVDGVAVNSSATAVPTPALLPGLIGMGIAALRKRKNEGVEQPSEA